MIKFQTKVGDVACTICTELTFHPRVELIGTPIPNPTLIVHGTTQTSNAVRVLIYNLQGWTKPQPRLQQPHFRTADEREPLPVP